MISFAAPLARAKASSFSKMACLAVAFAMAASAGARAQAVPAANDSPGVVVPDSPAAGAQAQIFGPGKPSANQAIRAALFRAGAQPLAPEQRALLRAVGAFYAERGDAPLFFADGAWTAQARGLFDRLQKAPEDGLDLRDIKVYSLDAAPENALAIGEIALAQGVAAYAFQASGGRIEPGRLSKLIGLHPEVVSPAKALEETAKADDAGAVLQSYNPPHPEYRALRDRLGLLRANPGAGQLAAQEPPPSPKKRRLNDARAAFVPSKAAQEANLLANMEIWRWEPRDLGADRIMVNVPEYVARLYRSDQIVETHRIVVGKPDTPTPLFSDKMEYLVVNPSWYVPQSIIKNEWGGRAQRGFDVTYENGQVFMRQPPGERNALGRLKFIFPNKYSVYMHDTPSRQLFAQAKRAFSHGCMRVDQPASWAVALLGAQNGWSEQRIEKMYGKSERRVNLPAPLPIHIGYFTETVNETGQLRVFDDVYGYVGEIKKLLGLNG